MKDIFTKKRTVISAVVFLAVVCAVFAASLLFPRDKIAEGVFARGTDLGGMTKSEALSVISRIKEDTNNLILYTAGGAEVEVGRDEIGLKRDVEKTLDKAFSFGRKKGFFADLAELISLRFSPVDIGCEYNLDSEKLDEIIYNFGVGVNGEYKKYVLEYGDETVLVQRGTGGQDRDTAGSCTVATEALKKGVTRIYVKLKKKPAPMPTLRSLYDEIYLEPKNAAYKVTSEEVIITPEIIGRQIDMIEAATAMDALRNGDTVELKLVWLMPEVTLSELEEKLFNHTLSQYTTAYSQKDAGRSANLEIAAEKIDGVILAPGTVFSFNEVVGPRTEEAGFQNAPVFENGETVQGMGGGVCQVSSTLYSAVLYADLEIVERQNHSMVVSYVPKGQDATVAYGSIDFKFKNSTDYPIKIIASAGNGKMSVSICGTRPDKEKTVRIVHNIISETPPEVKKSESRELDVGRKKVISAGKNGYTVSTERIVFEGGEEVKTEKMGTSTYKMVPAEVAIGAKVPAPLPALPARATPTPTPTPEPTPEEEENEEGEEGEEGQGEDGEKPEDAAEGDGENTENGEEGENSENTKDPEETPMPTPPVPEGLLQNVTEQTEE